MNQEVNNNVMATNMSLGQQPQVTQPAQMTAQPVQGQGLQAMVGQAQTQPAQGQGLQAMVGQAPAQGLQAMVGQTQVQPQVQQPAAPQVEGPMVIQSTGGPNPETAQESNEGPVINSNGTVSPQVEQPIVFDMGTTTTETQEEVTEPVQEVIAPSSETPEHKTGVVVESLLGDETKTEQAKPVVENLVSNGVNAPKQADNLVVNTPGGQVASTLEPAVVPTLNTPQTDGDIKASVESLMGGVQVGQSTALPKHSDYTLDPEVAKKHQPLTVETL